METNNIPILDIRLVQQLCSKKSDTEIAEFMDKPVTYVQQILSLYAPDQKLRVNAGKSLKVTKKEMAANKKKEKEQQRLAIATHKQEARRKKELEKMPKFSTKAIDYSQMTSIKIDAKTTIYAKPGEDTDEVKKRYLSRRVLSNHLSATAIK